MQMTFSIKPCRSGSLIMIILLLIGHAALGADPSAATGNRFYQDTKHGWFWYEDPPPEQKKQKTEPVVKPPREKPSLDKYSIDDLWNMYPDDFQELLNHVQKNAVQSPTERNILKYLVIQDVARRKALAYTNATMYVTQKYGDLLNVGQVYPMAGPGVTARVEMQKKEILQTISRAGTDHALLFFVKPGCGFCAKQATILRYFVEKYHWQVKTVNISRNTSAAARFNITMTPTLLLIKRGGETYMPVSVGVIALSELERKLYRAIRHLQGNTRGNNFLMYDFQKGSALDPTSILNKGRQPWAIKRMRLR